MKIKDTRIILENQHKDFLFNKSKSNLNISFNRISFIFFVFFIIFLIYSIHLIHLGSRISKINNDYKTNKITNSLYRADIVDVNNKYIVNMKKINEELSKYINKYPNRLYRYPQVEYYNMKDLKEYYDKRDKNIFKMLLFYKRSIDPYNIINSL